MPSNAAGPSGAFVQTASLPITTPLSFTPISAPHIQVGWENSTARVSAASGISI